MRGWLVSLLLGALLALPLPALAGSIYKCAGADGVDSYVSKRLPGARCKLVGSYRAGRAPLSSVEGFIRQILGWREYVRGIYWTQMPGYLECNALDAQRDA